MYVRPVGASGASIQYTLLSPAHACSLQLTETSSRYARKISGTTALQEALKEKQQHIEQLLAERDLERAEVAKATSHICEVEKEIALLKAQHEQVGGRQVPGCMGPETLHTLVKAGNLYNLHNLQPAQQLGKCLC